MGRGPVNFALSPSRTGTSCLCFSGGGCACSPAALQPGSPAAAVAARIGERADPRANDSERDCTLPAAAALRALTPLPVSPRSETGAVTLPESDGAAGPITPRSGSLGGGAAARRGPSRAGSLREAQPPGGPAGGGEGAGPGGEMQAAAVLGKAVLLEAEVQGARRREGLEVEEFIWRRPPAPGSRWWRFTSRCSEDACRAMCGWSRGGSGKGSVSRRITTQWLVRKRVFSTVTLFLPKAGVPPMPRSS